MNEIESRKQPTWIRVFAVVVTALIGAAIIYGAFAVRMWACEGADHPVRCLFLR